MAKRTGRHVLSIPAKDVRDRETLERVFRDEYISTGSVTGYYRVPYSDRLYVFEDIDCCDWREVVLDRSLRKREPDAGSSSSSAEETMVAAMAQMLAAASTVDADQKGGAVAPSSGKKKLEVSLADLLEVLDGLVEMPGRMMVITSNDPKAIDPALLRPGRVDEVLCFGPMGAADARRMYDLWFGPGEAERLLHQKEPADGQRAVVKALVEGGVTQAELGAMLGRARTRTRTSPAAGGARYVVVDQSPSQ